MLGIGRVARKIFGTPNDRKVKSARPLVEKINALEPEYEALGALIENPTGINASGLRLSVRNDRDVTRRLAAKKAGELKAAGQWNPEVNLNGAARAIGVKRETLHKWVNGDTQASKEFWEIVNQTFERRVAMREARE